MTIVVVFYYGKNPEKHFYEDYDEALAYAAMVFNYEEVQSIEIVYERTVER